MKAREELQRLQQKLESGDLPPDEPLFVLRARDRFAAELVRQWGSEVGRHYGALPREKILEAYDIARAMDDWPIKQVPGRPDTRETIDAEEAADTPSGAETERT